MHRPAVRAALVATGLALLLVAAPVAAKEGMAAELTTPIDRDAAAGTTLRVAWTAFQEDPADGDRLPFAGAPVFIRLVAPDGTSTHQVGDEYPADSGRFSAAITVPEGGIERVEIGLVGESCEGGTCTRNDLLFALRGAVFAGVPGAAPADPAAAPVAVPSTVPTPAGDASSPALAWLLALGVAAAVLAGGSAALIERRRRAAEPTAT